MSDPYAAGPYLSHDPGEYRYTLSAACSEWLYALNNATDNGGPMPEKFACPAGYDLELPSTFAPSLVDETDGPVQRVWASQIVVAAQELSFLTAVPGDISLITVLHEEDGTVQHYYYWEIRLDGYTLGRFTTSPSPLSYLAAGLQGVAAAEAILMEAVDEGNTLMDRIRHDANMIVAATSTVPGVLAAMAAHPEPSVQVTAVRNPRCPEEARVMHALQRRA